MSIDPGYERLGIAIVEKEKNAKEKLIFSECFKTSPKEEHGKRLLNIGVRLKEIIKEHVPNALSIESLFFNTNQKTALLVAEARGVILATATEADLKICEYTPPQIKLATTGYGKSDKEQIIKMLPMLIKIEKEIKYDDEYDAIAVGITFFAYNKV